MRPFHRSKCACGLALGFAATGACHGQAAITTRVVTTHVSPGCVSGGQTLDGNGYAKFYGSGDFEPTLPAAGHLLKDVGDVLSEIDPASRALVVDTSEGAGRWQGVTGIPPSGNVDVLLLPWLASCPFPNTNGVAGPTVAPVGADTVLLIGGMAVDGGMPVDAGVQAIPGTRVVHLSMDSVDGIDPDLRVPRANASVTAFGAGGLVAGGRDPRPGGAGVLASAEVYSPALGGIDRGSEIPLSTYRSDHGATVLATGETLLVGGVGQDGITLLSAMEIVDPVTRTVRAENVAPLAVARREPVVLGLASGEILVAGGVDAAGQPVATIEWFSPDVSTTTKRARDLVADASARAYVALQGGGALAVFAPPPAADPSYQSVWVIDADGTFEAAAPVPGTLTAPVLFGAAGGAPVLWTGDRWLRWQPWSGSFGAFPSLDPTPAHVAASGISPDPGLAAWLDPGTYALTLMRFDTRGTYSPLSGALLVTDASEMAPDSLSGPAGPSFDASVGLVLPPGRSAFVTDRTYADVAIDVDSPTGEPAVVVLRDELGVEIEVGGGSCPLSLASGTASSLHVERHGSAVTFRQPTGPTGTCPVAPAATARIAVGLRCDPSVARAVALNLRVVRL